MDSTKYTTDYDTHGLVKIEEIIDPKYIDGAREYEQLFKDLTLSGNIRRNNRTPEQVEIDKEATDLLLKFRDNEGNTPELCYGFMLYNEASITKIYWTKRVGKLRQDKREYFTVDKYLEWLTEIFAVLNGQHPKYQDPLYYFKFGKASRNADLVGDYDVMNSFRVHWNMYFLPILAIYLYQEDQKEFNLGVSIDAALENENGAGNHLEAEMVKNSKNIQDMDDYDSFTAVEEFLQSFTSGPLSEPVPLNTGAKGAGVTYRQVMIAIVDGTWTSGKTAYEAFKIGPSIRERILSKIKHEMTKYSITLEDFGRYLDSYRTTALDILNGEDASFTDSYNE